MRLPPGSTGFTAGGTAGPVVDQRAFVAACHHAARLLGGRVTATTTADVTPNFHTAGIVHGDRRVAVLRHAVTSLGALARPLPVGDMSVEFVDDPELADALSPIADFRLLTRAELSLPLSTADTSDLHPAEHAQIRHWQPATVGALLFNHWD